MNSLKTILYFSIFDYPLCKEEIKQYAQPLDNVDEELKTLIDKNIIFLKDGFYNIENNLKHIERRLAGNKKAKDLMPKAYKMSKRIMSFPFIEAVTISGALSKNFSYKDALIFANKVAGISTTKLGAAKSMPTLNEVNNY